MKAVLCPVCTGSGIVPAGFYERTSNTWTNAGGEEMCRGCNGRGWIEVHDNWPDCEDLDKSSEYFEKGV